jgi:hypothetical protein
VKMRIFCFPSSSMAFFLNLFPDKWILLHIKQLGSRLVAEMRRAVATTKTAVGHMKIVVKDITVPFFVSTQQP